MKKITMKHHSSNCCRQDPQMKAEINGGNGGETGNLHSLPISASQYLLIIVVVLPCVHEFFDIPPPGRAAGHHSS